MKQPITFYTKQKQRFETDLSAIKKKLTLWSLLRLFVFFGIAFAVYFFFDNTKIVMPLILIGIAIFLYLVAKHTDLKQLKDKISALVTINETELKVLQGDLTHLDFGEQYKDAQHDYSYDIDLFGEGSFFQYINRTTTPSGKKMLAYFLTENNITNIAEKQKSLKELAKKAAWRQEYSATASLVNVDVKAASILSWLKNHSPFTNAVLKVLPMLFFTVSVALMVLNYLDVIAFKFVVFWFLIGLAISGKYFKKVNKLYGKASKAKATFKQYQQLLVQLERENFTTQILSKKQQLIQTETIKASAIFKDFSKTLDALDQRNNVIFGIFANGFALYDLRQCYKLEQWISKYQPQVANWFEVIAFFDAQNSLANYVFNHPTHCFPNLNNTTLTINAEQLGHPLLNKEKRVDNDFSIKNHEFFIITGANMAGKSTFLRTVSLSIVMANIGLPVCAKKYEYSPIHLITSMRTSDSLSDDASYFFSELKRLKFIIDKINPTRSTKQYFIILDEILKGTNSKDKAIGSRKFVEKLVRSNATGIIATHDLSLCAISKDLKQVKNHYFDAEIVNDELHFDYCFKDGICQNMNASFLLRKMEII